MDGAMGTELTQRGIATPLPLWSAQALLDSPDTVRSIHEEYIHAGADIVTACTFRATPRALAKVGKAAETERLVGRAVSLAREAAGRAGGSREVLIAGALAPLEDCYRPDLAPPPEQADREHAEQVVRLGRAGVDVILIETMNTIAEAKSALRGAKPSGLPVIVSFICRNEREILSGELLLDAVLAVEPFKPDAILVNCVPPEIVVGCLEELARTTRVPTGCYPNVGHADMASGSWTFDSIWTPDRFAAASAKWVARGAQVIGGCCGTNAAHIRALRLALPAALVE